MNLIVKKIIAREFLFFLSALTLGIIAFLLIFPYNYYFSNRVKAYNEKISSNSIISENLLRNYNEKAHNQHWFTREWENRFGESIYIKGGDPLSIWKDSTFEVDFEKSLKKSETVNKAFKENRKPNYATVKIPVKKNRFSLDSAEMVSIEINSLNHIDHLIEADNNKIWGQLYHLTQVDSINYKWNNAWSKELLDFIKECNFRTADQFKLFIVKNMIESEDLVQGKKAIAVSQQIDSLKSIKIKTEDKLYDSDTQFKFGMAIFLITLCILFLFRYLFYGIKWSIKTIKRNDD